MAGLLLEPVEHWWACSSCDLRDRTTQQNIHTRMHDCPGLNGLNIPFIEVPDRDAKPKGQQRINMCEDYIGGTGRAHPIASVNTDREEGTDCTVWPEVAQVQFA